MILLSFFDKLMNNLVPDGGPFPSTSGGKRASMNVTTDG